MLFAAFVCAWGMRPRQSYPSSGERRGAPPPGGRGLSTPCSVALAERRQPFVVENRVP